MAKIVPRPTKYSLQITDGTRKPLMNVRTYTINMRSNDKRKFEDKSYENINPSQSNFIKIDDRAKKLSVNNLELNKINAISSDGLSSEISVFSDTGKFFKEEEQDRSEFIFLKKSNDKIVIHDLLYAKEEDFETTSKAPKLNQRQKR